MLTSVLSICGFLRFFSQLIRHFFRWRHAANAHATIIKQTRKNYVKISSFLKLNVQKKNRRDAHTIGTLRERPNKRTKKLMKKKSK